MAQKNNDSREPNTKRRRSSLLMATTVALTLQSAGCVRPNPPRPPPLPPQEQAANFNEIVQRYDSASSDGWDDVECREVSVRFLELSERSRGGLPEALYNSAMTLRNCGASEEVTALLLRADAVARQLGSDQSAGYAPALLVMGVDAAQRGDREGATELFIKARRADPRSAEAYTNLATIQRESGRWPEAQQNLRRALAVDSEQMEAYAQMALLYLDLAEDNPEMLDLTTLVCQQALSRAAQTEIAPVKAAPIHNAWGLALVKTGDIVGAVGQFDKARRLNPELFEAHLNFGSVNLSFRGYQAAEEALRKAVELQPRSYEAHLSLGVALRGLKRYGDARSSYMLALDIDGERPSAHYNLGVLAQDYLFGEAADRAEQVRVLQDARRSFQRFLEACERDDADCLRRTPSDPAEDLTESARRRIRDCESVTAALSTPET